MTAPPALPVEPAADDELLAVVVLHLDPRPGPPAGLVGRLEALGHHPLEPGLQARLEHLATTALLERWRLPGVSGQLELRQHGAAFGVGLLQERMTVQPDHVEDHVADRNRLRLPAYLGLC